MNRRSLFQKGAMAVATLLIAGSGIAVAVDRNNEDEVVKINSRASRFNYRQNEVLVKFKSSSGVTMRKSKSGKFATSGVNTVDALMRQLGAETIDQLMPLSGADVSRRQSRAVNGQVVVNSDLSKLYCIRFDVSKVSSVYEAIEMIKQLDDVEYAEPNYLVYSLGNNGNGNGNYEDEPLYSQQWGIQEVNLHQLWKKPAITDVRPVIGILDTGVDIEHADLSENIWTNPSEASGAEDADDDGNGFADDLHGWDFVNQTGRIGDWNGHGTHCAGTAAGVGINGKGVSGANPDALIMPVTVLQSDGVGDLATLIKGIDYAVANGATVLSMSLGTYAESIALEQALAKAYQKAVLVAAAGNDGKCIYPHLCPNPVTGMMNDGAPSFPAAYTFVLGVMASGKNGLTSWSNYDEDGPIYSAFPEEQLYNYELMAPGQAIISTFINGQYRTLNGTSMATPLVAGAVSRLIQCKDYSNKEILFGDLIHSTTKNGNVDFLAAYNITDENRQPTLHHVSNLLDDAEGGDGDGRADAGETIALYPTLRNDWGNAMNIRITLEMGENEDASLIEFITNDVEFANNLSSYAKGRSANPIVFKLSGNCVDGRHIKLRLRATCDNISSEMVQDFVITAENGVEIGGLIESDMTLYPNVHYIVTTSLAVPDGVKLTILPGTVLKFKAGTGLTVAENSLICEGTKEDMIVFTSADHVTVELQPFNFSNNTLKYVKFENLLFGIDYGGLWGINNARFVNSILVNINSNDYCFKNCLYTNTNIYNCFGQVQVFASSDKIIESSNFIGNIVNLYNATDFLPSTSMQNSNSFGNVEKSGDLMYNLIYQTTTPSIYLPEIPNYFGSAREDIVRLGVYDIMNINKPMGFGKYDLSNMLTSPSKEAHGVVWKVVVNGYDAQDEYELLPPLGVGEHKFEVYFNRPMNKAVAPMIAMGVRPPYTQTQIADNGVWNEEGTVYTAYLTISGKDEIDGVNRIYVSGAEDDEYFEIPVEDYRFNVNVQSAGSMSEGFMAEAGLGKVNLTWENPEENFDDMLGYNIYRYTLKDDAVSDTIRINNMLIEPEDTEFTDFDVVPGETYCYYYKVLRTSLTENSPSKIVAATPLTASKGDANGSMSVDVADVVTEVAYMTNQNPQPFIFDAADVNADLAINVLDVVGTVNIIRNPNAAESASINSTATYTVEDGILYVDSPIALGGVQFRLTATADAELTVLEALEAFEVVKDYSEESGWLLIAYSMSGKSIEAGKHALLNIGEAAITEAIFSDTKGQNVMAISGNVTGIGAIEAMQMQLPYPNPFRDVLNIPYVIGQEGNHDVVISISTPAGLTVASHAAKCDFGYYNYEWRPASHLDSGIYFVTLYVDDRLMQTVRVIYKK